MEGLVLHTHELCNLLIPVSLLGFYRFLSLFPQRFPQILWRNCKVFISVYIRSILPKKGLHFAFESLRL